jgi:hypothetical protein
VNGAVPDWDDVRRIALGLPQTSEERSRGLAGGGFAGKGRPADGVGS